jgi:hypothetical protein
MAINLEDGNGVQQIVFYGAGLGTSENENKNNAGLFGSGIDKHIKDLYTFLLTNYDDGDEVYMFGFSRGAYTVRSLAGLIRHSGLGRRDQLRFVEEAYEAYRNRIAPTLSEMKDFRRIPITLLACFDTVGALGIPGMLSVLNRDKYEFHNTTLSEYIQNAVHIMSIDEHRESAYRVRLPNRNLAAKLRTRAKAPESMSASLAKTGELRRFQKRLF